MEGYLFNEYQFGDYLIVRVENDRQVSFYGGKFEDISDNSITLDPGYEMIMEGNKTPLSIPIGVNVIKRNSEIMNLKLRIPLEDIVVLAEVKEFAEEGKEDQ